MNRTAQKSTGRGLALAAFASLLVFAHAIAAQAQWTTSGTNTTTTSNVGVGTAAPDASLHISTASTAVGSRGIIDEQTSNDANGPLLILRKSRAGAAVQNGDSLGNLYSHAFDGTSFVNSSRIRFLVDGTVSANSVPTAMQFLTGVNSSAAERMRITSAGNVGIGTAAPASVLDVLGTSGVTVRTGGASAGVSIFDRPSVPGDQLVFQGNKGNYSVLNVATKNANFGTEKIAGLAMWTVENTYTPDATQFQLQNSPAHGGVIFTQKFGTGAQGDKKVSFQTAWNQMSTPTQLVLDTNGNVGVGTATPAANAKLHVAGNIIVDGNINAKYQDVAEWVPSTQKLTAGMVVVLDAERNNHVLASETSYDTRVAGVISAQPGLSLGEAGEGKVLVATTGRVKVRVDATRAPVRIGDLLVTSDVAGVAMKSEPVEVGGRKMHAPGTIIGKALEPLEKGTGEILVLLSLQ
ncbi:MAG TPA: hypothetical protein VGV59_05410 [Pyrinomonadaceae bacterium]|nr:hypothetical protein [Pyrinomonadaceae bacterium]